MADPTSCASFSDTDKLVLRYSEILTRENKVSGTLYKELEKAFLREELLELAMTIGLAAMVNRVHSTFVTDVDQSTLEIVADGLVCPIGH